MMLLKRTALLTAIAFTLSTFAGCSGSTSSSEDTSSQTESKTAPAPQTHDDDFYIKWAIPDSIIISDEVNDKVNALLDEKYGLGVRFVPISDIPGEIDYHSELIKADADIAFAGFDSDDDKPCERLIAEGFFAPLDDMLKDSEFYSLIPTQLWKTTESNGSIYSIPSETMQDIGVCIVFDLDKIPAEKAKAFNGDITQLDGLLSDNDMLYYGLSDFDYSMFYGDHYSNGIITTQEGVAKSITSDTECMAWLKEMNSLFNKGKATDIECDWSVLITRDIVPISKENTYIYKTKAIVGQRFGASTGIINTSNKKQEAFKLLEIVHSDPEIANLLVYGNEYTEKDGYAYDASGEKIYSFINKLIFGVDSNVLFGADMLMQFSSPDEKKAYYDENVAVSPLAGIDITTDCKEINTVMNKYRSIWKSKDIDNDIAALNKELSDAGIEEILPSITEKIKQGAKK